MTRHIRIEGDVAYVPLTKGYEAVIDAADVSLVSNYLWQASELRRKDGSIRAVYAVRRPTGASGRRYLVLMHRVILAGSEDKQCDHIDGNGLNNRRQNLREVTHAENQRNRKRGVNNTSGVKGVTFNKAQAKWRAFIKVSGVRKYLGSFDTLDLASAAYAKASSDLHGEFGRAK